MLCDLIFLFLFHHSTGLVVMLHVFNIKVKNLAFGTSKIMTNSRFSMKNYGSPMLCVCYAMVWNVAVNSMKTT